jgi:CDP-diacylglycerol--glycerol-3-phosphate 3-phosphatidyltransferase
MFVALGTTNGLAGRFNMAPLTTETKSPRNIPVLWNWPNLLTGLRFVLSIPVFVSIMTGWFWLATSLFALAAFSDWLDGFLARRLKSGTALGRNLDPLADKVLVCGALTLLISVPDSGVADWMVVVIVCRELIVTSLRSFLEHTGTPFGAAILGKLKMVLQSLALLAVLLSLAWSADPQPSENWQKAFWLARDALLYATVAITVISGIEYVWRAYKAYCGRLKM